MTKDKKIQQIVDEERYKEEKEMTTEEWNAKLEEKNKAKPGKMMDKKRRKKLQGKVIHGTTPEERFEEIHGMTIDERNAKHEAKFKEKTGMTPDEWVLNRYKNITPIDLINEYDVASKADETLIEDLQDLGLNNEVINVLLEYVFIFNGIGFVQSLVLEIGKNWLKNDILTVEKAIEFIREEHRKHNESLEK
ncbi:DnaD domain protein [Psychrobacillus sp. BM2]|uniref:DnaD domain protein n=1 Tax=Psychrobacillus sp. BM2 TaxID=3400421 RepID=UPI003B020C4E